MCPRTLLFNHAVAEWACHVTDNDDGTEDAAAALNEVEDADPGPANPTYVSSSGLTRLKFQQRNIGVSLSAHIDSRRNYAD